MLVRGKYAKDPGERVDARAIGGCFVANHQLRFAIEDYQQLLFVVQVRRVGTMAPAQHRNVAVHMVDDRSGTAEELVRLPAAARVLVERSGIGLSGSRSLASSSDLEAVAARPVD